MQRAQLPAALAQAIQPMSHSEEEIREHFAHKYPPVDYQGRPIFLFGQGREFGDRRHSVEFHATCSPVTPEHIYSYVLITYCLSAVIQGVHTVGFSVAWTKHVMTLGASHSAWRFYDTHADELVRDCIERVLCERLEPDRTSPYLVDFFLAALRQKSMVTANIYRSGSRLAGISVDFTKKGFRGIRDFRILTERRKEEGKHD